MCRTGCRIRTRAAATATCWSAAKARARSWRRRSMRRFSSPARRPTAKNREPSPAPCAAVSALLGKFSTKKGSDPFSLGGRAFLALALMLFQEALAEANRLRRDLGELVVADELDRVLERQRDRRGEVDGLVLARGADVGELLGLDRVRHQVVVARVDADDHALVHRVARADEHAAALLQLPKRVGDGDAVVLRYQDAVAVLFELALGRRVVVEHMAHDPGAARHRHELALQADQAARRDAVVQAHAAL